MSALGVGVNMVTFPEGNAMYLSVARVEQGQTSQNQGQLIFLLSKRKQRKGHLNFNDVSCGERDGFGGDESAQILC